MKKKAATPLILFPGETQKDSNSDYNWSFTERHERRSMLSYVKGAATKVAGVFTFFFKRRKKSTSGDSKSEALGSLTPDRVSSFSSTTSYLSDSYSKRSAIVGGSGTNQISNSSRYRYGSKANSSNIKSWHLGPVIFSFDEILNATRNFSPENSIGEGGFGTVYRGKLIDGSLIAAKRARKQNYGNSSLMEFKNEIYTLSKIEHRNLVKLFGFLEHGDEKIIVVEYVGNGNLRQHLDGLRGNPLDMAERLEIAIDVAHAVTYLHTYSDTPMIHRDIKASNILITEKLRAKVADFGFARLISGEAGVTHITTQVKGSSGYVDPEYLRSFQLTELSDVYSFGVLLVELITGRRPIETKRPRKERLTVRWAMQNLREQEAVVVMDRRLRRSGASNMAAENILKLAQKCLAPSRSSRPTMKTCVEVLWEVRKRFREMQLSSASSSSHYQPDQDETEPPRPRRMLPRIEDEDHDDQTSNGSW